MGLRLNQDDLSLASANLFHLRRKIDQIISSTILCNERRVDLIREFLVSLFEFWRGQFEDAILECPVVRTSSLYLWGAPVTTLSVQDVVVWLRGKRHVCLHVLLETA